MYKKDWGKVVEKYNKNFECSYKDDEEMLSDLYELFPMDFIAEVIEVSKPTLNKRMKELGVKE